MFSFIAEQDTINPKISQANKKPNLLTSTRESVGTELGLYGSL